MCCFYISTLEIKKILKNTIEEEEKCKPLPDDELKAELRIQLDKEFKGIPYMLISSIAQQGLLEVKDKLWKMLNN